MDLTHKPASESPGGLVKVQLAGPRAQTTGFRRRGVAGVGLEIGFSNKFPGSADAAGPGTPL